MAKQWQCVPNVAHPNYRSQQQKQNEWMLFCPMRNCPCLSEMAKWVSEWKNGHRHRLWPIYSYLIEYWIYMYDMCRILEWFDGTIHGDYRSADHVSAKIYGAFCDISHYNERTDLIRIVWIFFLSASWANWNSIGN